MIDLELLKIRINLVKNPEDYAVNNPNKKVGMLLGAKAGDVIWYFRMDGKKGALQSILKKLTSGNTKRCSWLQSKMPLKYCQYSIRYKAKD